jgi:hypothetical protein
MYISIILVFLKLFGSLKGQSLMIDSLETTFKMAGILEA